MRRKREGRLFAKPWTRARTPGRDPRPAPPGFWFDALLLATFSALTAGLVWWPPLLRLDLAVRDWCDAHRPQAVYWLVWLFDHVGQGGPVMVTTLIFSFYLGWRQRTARPIMPAALAAILTTVSIVALKRWTSRGSPHFGTVHLFGDAGGMEYPSGHVNNALVYYGVLAMLLAPLVRKTAWRFVQWAPGILVFVGTTYIGYHWLSDSIGGYLLGLFLVRIIFRIPWRTVWLPRWLDQQGPQRRAVRAPTRD